MTRVLTLEDFPPVPFQKLALYDVDDVVHAIGALVYQYGYDTDSVFIPLVLPTLSEMSQYFYLSELDMIRVMDKCQGLGITLEFKDSLSPIQVLDAKPTLILKLAQWLERLFPALPHPLKHSIIS